MHDGLVFWMYVVFIICLLWLMCGYRCCLVGLGLWGGLGLCTIWSWNGEKLVSVGTEVISSSEVLCRCDCSSSILVLECSCNSMELTVKC